MTEIFKEALLLSNKTYFLEEMSKQRGIQKELRKQVEVKDKIVESLAQKNSIINSDLVHTKNGYDQL